MVFGILDYNPEGKKLTSPAKPLALIAIAMR